MKEKDWWLKKDCRECDFYPVKYDCWFKENTPNPRGCSMWQHTPKEDIAITEVVKGIIKRQEVPEV
jgi:hypothetical protein